MTKSYLIDNSINKSTKDIALRHDLSKWGYISIVVLALPFIASLLVPSLREGGFYSFAITMLIFAATIAVCMIAYYLLGDSRRPYFKPTHDWMERCEFYFDGRNIETVKSLIKAGDFRAIADMPRNHSQQYLIIIYKAPKSNFVGAQIARYGDSCFIPESEIFLLKGSDHNIPKGTSLLDFFFND